MRHNISTASYLAQAQSVITKVTGISGSIVGLLSTTERRATA